MRNRSCPFYGRSSVALFTVGELLQLGENNGCALIEHAHSPCIMEINGVPVSWRACPRNPEVVDEVSKVFRNVFLPWRRP